MIKRICILLMLVALISGCAKNGKQPYPAQQSQEWNNCGNGLRASVLVDFERNHWGPLTKTEAIRYAQDIGFSLIDDRLPLGESTADHTNSVFNGETLWAGWKVRLFLPGSEQDYVEMVIQENGYIRHIQCSSHAFHGTLALGRTLMSVHHWTAEKMGGEEKLVAALTAMDIVRVMSEDFVGLNVIGYNEDNNGDWTIYIGNGDIGAQTTSEVRLSSNFSLLEYSCPR